MAESEVWSSFVFSDNMVEDMDVDLEKEFLQDLKELKILITDRDLLDQHKRHESVVDLLLIAWCVCYWLVFFKFLSRIHKDVYFSPYYACSIIMNDNIW